MKKQKIFESLKLKHPSILKIDEVDDKKFSITIDDDKSFNDEVKQIRKSILETDSDEPLLIEINNHQSTFDFSVFGGIYDLIVDGINYRVEYDLKEYILSYTGFTETIERYTFQKQYPQIHSLIKVINSKRDDFLGYSKTVYI